MDNNGEYKLKCNKCDVCYVGETGRVLKIRIKEYTTETKYSVFHNHIIEQNNDIDLGNTKLIDIQNKGIKLNLLEALEIYKSKKKKQNYLRNKTI